MLENENDLQSDLLILYVSDEYCRRGDKERTWRMEYLDGKCVIGERARVGRRSECQLKENPVGHPVIKCRVSQYLVKGRGVGQGHTGD